MKYPYYLHQLAVAAVVSLGLTVGGLDATAQVATKPVTLTYSGLGVNNNDPVPEPYPGITAATVSHYGGDNTGAIGFEDVFFRSATGFGDLSDVAYGPPGTPASPPAWGIIYITPNYSGAHVRLISFDAATFDDGAGDPTIIIYILDQAGDPLWFDLAVPIIGDTTPGHTLVNFGGVPIVGLPDQRIQIWWQAVNGRVAVDNVNFEIVGPRTANDYYSVTQGGTLVVPAPGVLGNDLLRETIPSLTASQVTGPTAGTLNLASDGGFSYTSTGPTGLDSFTYLATDGGVNFAQATALVSVLPPGVLFSDDFTRPAGFTGLTPWEVRDGTWTMAGGLLTGTPDALPGHADIYVDENWTDYSVEVRARVGATGYGWAVAGRLNAVNGDYYECFLYANVSPGAPWKLHLTKHIGWGAQGWDGQNLANQPDVVVPVTPGDTTLHSLKMTFIGNRILVEFDGVQYMDVTDNNFPHYGVPWPVLSSGGIMVGMYSENSSVLNVEDVIVRRVSSTPSSTPSLDTSASAVDLDGNNTASLAFAQGELTDGYIVVGVSMYDPVVGASITSVTYDGAPMALLGTIQDANAYSEVYLFGLAVGNKAAGNYNVVLTGSTGIDQLAFGVSSFLGVNQTAPTGPFASATGSSLAASVDVGSGVGDLVVDIIGQDNGTSTLGADQLQNWRQEDATDRVDGVSSREVATAETTTMSYLESEESTWSLGALALKGSGPPPADTTPPTITSVTALNATTVQVVFSEPVATTSAETEANYAIDNGVTISLAVLGADTRTVTLTTSALAPGNYILRVNNVTDRATAPNPIAPNSQAAFSFGLAPASPVFNTAASAVDLDGNNSASLIIAQGALTDGYVVVGVSMWDPLVGASITSVTYDGVPMTLLGTIQDANAYSEAYLFGLAVGNKPAGNYNVVLTGSTGIDQVVFGVSAFSGVSQTTPTGPFASATGSSTAASVAVTSVAGDVVVDIISQDDGTSTLGAGQTQNWRQEDATDRADGVSSRETATGATTTMSYTESVASSWSLAGVALKGAGPPPPDTTRPTIVSVSAVNATTVQVVYSEPVAEVSAETLANYAIDNGVTISLAVLGGDTVTVTLTTSTMATGNYLLTVNNVTDRATVPNAILPGTQAAFSYSTAPASPVFNTAASKVETDGNNSASLVLAQGVLTDGYVVVGVSMWDPLVGASITSVTYDGVAMTLLGTIQDANAYSEAYLFGLAVGNKPAGNYNVVLTGSTGIDQVVFGASAFSGVSQTASTGPVATGTGSSTAASVAVSSAAGDVVVDIISQDDGTSTLGAGQTQNWRQEDATDRADGVSSRETATGTTTTMSYTESVASSWSMAGVALKGAGPPPPDTTKPTIVSVSAVNATTVQVVYSEPVEEVSAETVGNYSISGGVTISAAVLGADTVTVTLTTSALSAGNYTLTVNNVTDRATVPNAILPGSQAAFSYAISPVFNAAASKVEIDNNNSASLVLAQGALNNGYIVVGVSMWDPVVGASITSVTYDGVPMTLLGTIQDANAYSEAYLFGLAVGNKAAGNYNVVVTGSTGIDQVVFGASAFSGVNQTTSTGPVATGTGSSTTASVAVSSAAGDVVVDIISQDDGTSTLGAGQTQNWRQEDATDRQDGVSSRETATGATTTMSYTESVASSWSMVAIALKP